MHKHGGATLRTRRTNKQSMGTLTRCGHHNERIAQCAYGSYEEEFGAEGRTLLDALGMRRIPASEVTLHPFLLGERFQRIADRAVLRRNGIGKPGTDGLRK